MSERLHAKCPLFLSCFNETWISSADFWKKLNIKFNQNSSSGSRVVPCGQTKRRTDMTKLILAFRNFANAPKKWQNIWALRTSLYLINRKHNESVHVYTLSPKKAIQRCVALLRVQLVVSEPRAREGRQIKLRGVMQVASCSWGSGVSWHLLLFLTA